MVLIDSHCHIPLIAKTIALDSILSNAQKHDVAHLLCVAIDLFSIAEIIELAENYSQISATIGIHPNTITEQPCTVDDLVELGAHKQVVGIGETGLDYFRHDGVDETTQKERLRTHIQAAKQLKKPLIIHMRSAKEDILQILKEEKADEVGGVMHCFNEDIDTAYKAIDLNFMISFSGIVTFKNAVPLQDVAKQIPLSHILVETDSPYLTPVPHRGKTNQPAYVHHVAKYIAQLKEIDFASIALHTTQNYYRLFGTQATTA